MVVSGAHAEQALGHRNYGAGNNKFLSPKLQGTNIVPDVEINMRATTTTAPILPGTPTQVMSYQATLVKGPQTSLITLPDNYLGPAWSGCQITILVRSSVCARGSI